MPEIHDRGRGPEIRGTRITVYDVMDSMDDWTAAQIAALFKLTVEEIQVALDYIAAHRDEVTADYQKILARHAKGNSPEVLEIIKGSHERLLARVAELKRIKGEKQTAEDASHAGNLG